MKTLSDKQIERLFDFTREHYVEWYDLQSELVDHLANDIENEWEENPELSFENALDITFKKFGIFGFADVVEEKQKSLTKQYRRLIFTEFRNFFVLPKIVMTLLSIYLVFLLLSIEPIQRMALLSIVLAMGFFQGYKTKQFIKKQKNEYKKFKKNWLAKSVLLSFYGFSVMFIYYPFFFNWSMVQYLASEVEIAWTLGFIVFMSFCVVITAIYIYVSTILLPQEIDRKLAADYGELRLQKN